MKPCDKFLQNLTATIHPPTSLTRGLKHFFLVWLWVKRTGAVDLGAF